MVFQHEVVLAQFYAEMQKQKPDFNNVYRQYALKGKVDDLISDMLALQEKGYIIVPTKSWSRGGDGDVNPIDVVMTGVKITPLGHHRITLLKQIYK